MNLQFKKQGKQLLPKDLEIVVQVINLKIQNYNNRKMNKHLLNKYDTYLFI